MEKITLNMNYEAFLLLADYFYANHKPSFQTPVFASQALYNLEQDY